MMRHNFVLALILCTLVSCNKDTDVVYLDPLYPDQEQFRSSLFVEVVNASGQPVANTLIRIGNYKRQTDVRGLVYLNDVLVGASTYLIADKEGYFHASRRFYPSAGSSQYIKLIMLSDSRDAFFSSESGADLPVNGVVTLHFPKDGYEYTNGESYDGVVVVSAKSIAADDPDLSYKMPGDLTGIDANGQAGSLASMGMVAVELKSSEGSLLRLKKGVQVQIDMTIPASNLANAPSTIPMWYFDENAGLWKEEGSATLSGNTYIGNVAHFSYWNYDAMFPAIKWGAIFDFGNRGIASQVEVCITIISLNTTKCAYTNSDGMVCGLVAANELLLMEVRNECGDVLYSEEIGPFSEPTMMGPITLSDPGLSITNISGHGVNCAGDPVTDGYAIIKVADFVQYTSLNELTGAFSLAVSTCVEDDVQITLVDVPQNKLSIPLNISYAPVIDAGTIMVCEVNQEFVDLEVVGFPDHFLFNFPQVDILEDGVFIYQYDSLLMYDHFAIAFDASAIGVYTPPDGVYISVTLPDGTKVHGASGYLNVSITYFGGPGDFIKGNLSGTWFEGEPGAPGGVEYPLLGSFSVLRDY